MIGFPDAEGDCAWAEEKEKLAAAKQAASKTGECRFVERNGMGAYRRPPSRPVTGAVTVDSAPASDDVGVEPVAGVLGRPPSKVPRAGCELKVVKGLLGDDGVMPDPDKLLITLPKDDGEPLPDVGAVTKPPTLATKVPAALTTSPVLDSTGAAENVAAMSWPKLLTAKPAPTNRLLTGKPRPVEAPRPWVVASTSIAIMWIMVLPLLVICCTTALSMASVMLPLRLAMPAPVSFSSAPAGSVTGLKAFS